jgi:hypothetical protein
MPLQISGGNQRPHYPQTRQEGGRVVPALAEPPTRRLQLIACIIFGIGRLVIARPGMGP